jgi:hypothetical protein
MSIRISLSFKRAFRSIESILCSTFRCFAVCLLADILLMVRSLTLLG